MAKVTLTDLVNLQNETTTIAAINANNTAIEAALEKTLSRDGTAPNVMDADFDMDSNRILNLPEPLLDTEPARLLDLGNAPVYAAAALASQVAAAASATSASSSDTASAASATSAASSASAASTSATNSATSASAASTSATAAAASATTASTQATNAASSASTASTQATNAAASASSASTSATTATTQASAASASATAAAGSDSSASTSASTATTQASAASASAAAAAASVAALSATSTTSLAVGTGTKVFTTQSGKLFVAGQYLNIASNASALNYMHGTVTSYSGTTLTMNITDIGGSGTLADWNISISGTQGSTGATGPAGSLNFSTVADATVADNDYLAFGDVSDSNNTKRTLVSTAVQTELTAHASTSRTNLGLVIGTNVQAYDATLGSIASLGTAADKMIYTTGVDTWAELAVTSVGRGLLDDTTQAAQQTTLGLGTGDSPQFTAINIGHASDTTLARVSAGVVSIEGSTVPTLSVANTWTAVQGYAFGTLTYNAAQTWDVSTNPMAALAPTGNITSFACSNAVAGRMYVLKITQDTSPRTIAYTAANFKFNAGSPPTLSTGSGAIDYITFIASTSTLLHETGRSQAVA